MVANIVEWSQFGRLDEALALLAHAVTSQERRPEPDREPTHVHDDARYRRAAEAAPRSPLDTRVATFFVWPSASS